MKINTKQLVTTLILFISVTVAVAQDLSMLKNVDVNTLSDDQIKTYWQQIQKSGYSIDEVEVLAEVQGISPLKIAAFKRRVQRLQQSVQTENSSVTKEVTAVPVVETYGLKESEKSDKKEEEVLLFGYDFFNNSKISFAPNVNIAVPANYQIGPGDEIMIDLWGATETTLTAQVNNSGQIKVNGVGLIYVNGFTLEKASEKIIAKLKTIYTGIGAAAGSYAKIHTNVTVSKIRTVQVNIIGEVKTPGTYSLSSLSTALNALYVAGGPSKLGTFRDVQLIRGNKKIASLDVYEYLISGTHQQELKLQDQDVLHVGPYKNLVLVEGMVKRPGFYELTPNQTLEDLIRYFGGFTAKSYTSLFVIERFNGNQKEVKEVALSAAATFVMQAGDKLLVQEVLDEFKNKVAIAGAIFRPGNFEFTPGMDVKSLITKAEGITPEAFLERGLLIRTIDETQKINTPFSVKEILNDAQKIVLQAKDSVRIFNKNELEEPKTITISGQVNTPQTIDFVQNLQIEDVIALSGGLTDAADPTTITVSRRLKDGSFVTMSEIFSLAANKDLSLQNQNPFYLQPFDIVQIAAEKGYTKQQTVTILGEVLYPGNYALRTKNEKVSDLIERAKGFTPFAFLPGANLIRNGKKIQNISFDKSPAKTTHKNGIDISLLAGDSIFIPTKLETITISGAIQNPSLVSYQKGKSLKEYINQSGGFLKNADLNNTYVTAANGDVTAVKKFLFFKKYPTLSPGATISVPEKPENEHKKMSTTEIVGITSSLATLAILLQTLLK